MSEIKISGNFKVLFIFLISVLLQFVLSLTMFTKWDSFLYLGGIIPVFFLTYFFFEFLQKEVKFDFRKYYIGIILILLAVIGFYLAFRIYYGSLMVLNPNIESYSMLYKNLSFTYYSYSTSSPYIYMAISAISGWFAFKVNK